ncbi:MAG: TIGR03089 family protein [Actinobacteria bacterium]|nr:TIGR03089 family protein [Actinomycetota bacterium]
MSSPEKLFDERVASDPTGPLITYYDDASGERSELSAKSLANWVTKTHYLLVDALGLGAGDVAAVALPAHWITVPVLLGAWSAGLTVSDTEPADVAFVTPTTAARVATVTDVYAIAPDATAGGLGTDAPVGLEDYVLSVRPQPDVWATVRFGADADAAAIRSSDGSTISRAELVDAARVRAGDRGLSWGARVFAPRPWLTPTDWIDGLLAPLAVGASIVLVANEDLDRRARRLEQERVTLVLD